MNNVDTTKTTTHLGLCAGYGGIELGLKRVIADMRTVALCEIEAFACANLVAKMEAGLMDAAPIWSDLKTFPWAEFRGRVDILTGGYPCQPFSAAGKRAGKDDPRHLWPWIADGIRAMRPRACFFENVEGHISMGLSSVISDLEEMGYRVAWGIFSASEVGAPHQRKRVFIVADSECNGLRAGRDNAGTEEESKSKHCNTWPSRPSEPQHAWEPPRVVTKLAEPKSIGCSGLAPECGSVAERSIPKVDQPNKGHRGELIGCGAIAGEESDEGCAAVGDAENSRCRRLDDESSQIESWKARRHLDRTSSSEQQEQWEVKRPLGRDVDGATSGLDYAELCVSCDNRTDELRLLGNGVVPATAEKAFCVLMQKLDENK